MTSPGVATTLASRILPAYSICRVRLKAPFFALHWHPAPRIRASSMMPRPENRARELNDGRDGRAWLLFDRI